MDSMSSATAQDPPAARGTAMSLHRYVALLVGLLVIITLLAYVGPESVLAALAGASPTFIGVGFAAYATFFLVRGHRWQRLLEAHSPSVRYTTTVTLSGMGWLISTFVPFKAGDVTRAALAARRERAAFPAVLGTVAVERTLDAMALAVAASVGLLALHLSDPPHLPPWVGGMLGMAWLSPLFVLAFLTLGPRLLPRTAQPGRLRRFADEFLSAAGLLLKRRRALPGILLLSAATATVQVLIFVALFLAFKPAAPLLVLSAGVPLFLLANGLSFVPAHLGTYEVAFVAVFAVLGFDALELLPMALAIHLLTISIVTVLGGLAFVVYRWTATVPMPPPPPAEARA